MQVRRTSGLTQEDLLQTKIYMRTITDALQCAQSIAENDAAKTHYKEYMSQLINSLRNGPMIVDNQGKVLSSVNNRTLMIYRLMTFSQEVVQRYGLQSENIKDSADLNNRLDRAIKGLETEVGLKQAHCQRLME